MPATCAGLAGQRPFSDLLVQAGSFAEPCPLRFRRLANRQLVVVSGLRTCRRSV